MAPSSPFPRDEFELGLAKLKQRYEVTYSERIFAKAGYFAGTDSERLKELLDALGDDSVDAIMAARGGYGATRLLGAISTDLIRDTRKALIGFSDVTALHALWNAAGVRSVHGPVVCSLGRAGSGAFERLARVLEGEPSPSWSGLTVLSSGTASGPIVGGNLSVLAALAPTDWVPPLKGSILFLEDVSERPYRVDRMLTTLLDAGWFKTIAGVIVGAFSKCDPNPDGVTVDDVLRERLGSLGIPVLLNAPAGHIDDNHEMVFGAVATIHGDSVSFEKS